MWSPGRLICQSTRQSQIASFTGRGSRSSGLIGLGRLLGMLLGMRDPKGVLASAMPGAVSAAAGRVMAANRVAFNAEENRVMGPWCRWVKRRTASMPMSVLDLPLKFRTSITGVGDLAHSLGRRRRNQC